MILLSDRIENGGKVISQFEGSMDKKPFARHFQTLLFAVLIFYLSGCYGLEDDIVQKIKNGEKIQGVEYIVQDKNAIVRADLTSKLFEVKFDKTGDWQSGFGANLTITNLTKYKITSWKLELDFDKNISTIWCAKVAGKNGNKYIIEGDTNNSFINPEGKVTFGFNGTPGNITKEPTNYILQGSFPLEEESQNTGNGSVKYTTASDWGSGFTGNLEITNTNTAKATDWSLEFDYNKTISSLWNEKIISS